MPTPISAPPLCDLESSHPAPTVTVIIATFDRSNIVGDVIRSVIAQTWNDWELLVVGDGCTDDTAEVVAAFLDERIRFVNLDPRIGDQSGPTNAGIELARGRYIALLNHDDFWFPDHLARALATLERTGADLTFTMQLESDPDGRWRVNASFPDGTGTRSSIRTRAPGYSGAALCRRSGDCAIAIAFTRTRPGTGCGGRARPARLSSQRRQ